MTKVSIFKYHQFTDDESGAATVDWVVLTAAVVGIALVAIMPVFSATESASNTANLTLQGTMSRASEIE